METVQEAVVDQLTEKIGTISTARSKSVNNRLTMAWLLRSLTTKNITSREAALLDKEIQRINQILQETTKDKKKIELEAGRDKAELAEVIRK